MTAHTGLKITNMTNDVLSYAAIEAIVNKVLDEDSVSGVTLKCTVSGDDGVASEFDVYDMDGGEGYLFSVTNDGVTYDK